MRPNEWRPRGHGAAAVRPGAKLEPESDRELEPEPDRELTPRRTSGREPVAYGRFPGSVGRKRSRGVRGPFATRLPAWLGRELLELGRRMNLGPSQTLRRIVEEWWTLNHDPLIEFREDHLGRRAALRRGPDVWEVVRIQKEYGDRPGVLEHAFPHLRRKELEAALRYWEHFPESVERFIIEYDRRQLWDKMEHVARMNAARSKAAFVAGHLEGATSDSKEPREPRESQEPREPQQEGPV